MNRLCFTVNLKNQKPPESRDVPLRHSETLDSVCLLRIIGCSSDKKTGDKAEQRRGHQPGGHETTRVSCLLLRHTHVHLSGGQTQLLRTEDQRTHETSCPQPTCLCDLRGDQSVHLITASNQSSTGGLINNYFIPV